MKNNTVHVLLASERTAIFAVDVSKDNLNIYADLGKEIIEIDFPNKTETIEMQLKGMRYKAKKAGFGKCMIVCEPTGIYHMALFRIADRLGYQTRQVSTESVAKMRVIETNDAGKTDAKYPKVILTLAKIGKTQKHRRFSCHYQLLREWNQVYEDTELAVVRAKCAIHPVVKKLFPDFGFKSDFLYSRAGKALIEYFKINPYRIIQFSKEGFAGTMREKVPRIRQKSIDLLYEQAKSATINELDPEHIEFLENRICQLYRDIEYFQMRKAEIRGIMVTLYTELQQEDPNLLHEVKGVVSTFYLARIFAETGPFSDFSSWRKLFRYAGLNLRERQSGTYRGKTKISKKGRPLLRKILSQAVLLLVREGSLYGEYYHIKTEDEKACGRKVLTSVSRKFLKMLYGWYKSGGEFDVSRVFHCESEIKYAA